jgi:predicted Zn-dependent peptidase
LESVEELQKITLDMLHKYYFSRLDKNWVNLGSAIKPDDPEARNTVINGLETLAAALPWSNEKLVKPQPAEHDELFRGANEEPLLVDLDREQSTVICATAGGFAHKREYYALLILDSALNGLSSNLFKEVREKRSLAYSTGIAVNCGLVQGVVALHAGVKPENARETLECLQNEILRLKNQGLSAEEFTSAQLSASTALARQLESSDAQLMHAQLALFYGDDPEESLNCTRLLRSITLQECNDVLQKIFSSSPIARVVAGNIEKIG